jgi:hypothetical protein
MAIVALNADGVCTFAVDLWRETKNKGVGMRCMEQDESTYMKKAMGTATYGIC